MLRLRPIHYTDHIDDWARLLEGLGLVRALDFGDWLEFDSLHGRVALQRASAADAAGGDSLLAFEVGNLDEFVRRTRKAGTDVDIRASEYGRTAAMSGPDGLAMIADVEKERPEPASADASVHVMPVWRTPDVGGAAQTLRNLGAKTLVPGDGWTQLGAKNGGMVGVHAGTAPGVALSFEYDGDAQQLLERLASAGFSARLDQEAFGRTVKVANPDGGEEIWVNEWPAGE